MAALRLIAGKTARKRIEQNGLTPDLVRMVVGASGGPKWLVLMGLDKFIFGHWLSHAPQKIDLVGSSIGAWRMTAAAHPDPARALERFHDLYFRFKKSDAASPQILTKASYRFLDDLYGDQDAKRIVENDRRNLNIVTVRSKGLKANASKWMEGAGILASAGANTISRAYLAKFFDRVVFHSSAEAACPTAWQDFDRTDVKLRADILGHVLMATGSIPFVVNPIINIKGAPAGIYRDGGVIDYHFDVAWRLDEGIILYPHFYDHIIPGWFDKRHKARRAKGATWDHMLMLAPSGGFVDSLPDGRIPERRNFIDMTDEDRIAYWRTVTSESNRLADEFLECLESPGLLMDRLEAAPI